MADLAQCVCTRRDDQRYQSWWALTSWAHSDVPACYVLTQTLFMWIQLESSRTMGLKCLFVYNLCYFLTGAAPKQSPLCLRGKNSIHSQNTFICGSLYTCEIRAHWPSHLFGKQPKQIVIKTFDPLPQKQFELQWCFKEVRLFSTFETFKNADMFVRGFLALAPVWIYICSHSFIVYQKVLSHNQNSCLELLLNDI